MSNHENPPPDGRQGATPAMQLSPSFAPAWKPSISQKAAAGRAADELFKFCELPDTGDPEAFLAAAILILADFPMETMMTVVNPSHGLPSRVRRPALCDIRKACEAAFEPLGRKLARDKIATEQYLRSAEQHARIASQATQERPARLDDALAIDGDEEKIEPDLKGQKRDDPEEAQKQTALDAKQRAETDRTILREYAQLHRDPVYAGPWLISPSLVRLIKESQGHPSDQR